MGTRGRDPSQRGPNSTVWSARHFSTMRLVVREEVRRELSQARPGFSPFPLRGHWRYASVVQHLRGAERRTPCLSPSACLLVPLVHASPLLFLPSQGKLVPGKRKRGPSGRPRGWMETGAKWSAAGVDGTPSRGPSGRRSAARGKPSRTLFRGRRYDGQVVGRRGG